MDKQNVMENEKLKGKREQNGDKPEVVVSLTSFPGAVEYARKAIDTVLKGSVLPSRIVLYLATPQFEDYKVPEELLTLQEECPIFEIRYYPTDIKSYKKLVPALRDFPEAVIVTIDDDALYHRHMLRRLLHLHEKNPEYIIAHRAKRIKPDKPYKKWPKFRWYHFLKKTAGSHLILQTGVGGVLYPPHSLDEKMIDEKLFMDIAPTADDIWFWAAAVSKGTKILPVPFGYNKVKSAGRPSELSLKWINFKRGKDLNKAYFDKILSLYPEIKKRIDDECAK